MPNKQLKDVRALLLSQLLEEATRELKTISRGDFRAGMILGFLLSRYKCPFDDYQRAFGDDAELVYGQRPLAEKEQVMSIELRAKSDDALQKLAFKAACTFAVNVEHETAKLHKLLVVVWNQALDQAAESIRSAEPGTSAPGVVSGLKLPPVDGPDISLDD